MWGSSLDTPTGETRFKALRNLRAASNLLAWVKTVDGSGRLPGGVEW